MWLRATLKSVAVAVSLQLWSCGGSSSCRPQDSVVSDTTISAVIATDDHQRPSNIPESCDSCGWKLAAIEFVDAIPTDAFKITQPTAIEFFTIGDDKSWFDSLRDDIQTYYRMVDQYGYYITLVRPKLEGRGVKIISKPERTVYFFEDNKHEYIVDATVYSRNDGVLMFTPGKEPVFWTEAMMKPGCADSTFIECYFGK